MLKFRTGLQIIRNYSNIITKMSKPVLYGDDISPPVRFVMITAKLLGINYDFHRIDLIKGENKTESYKKINPLQKVPAMSINGNLICDSHVIALYLCRNVEQDLYPKDPIQQVKVNQMLFFNATTLFPVDSDIFADFFVGKWPTNEAKVSKWYTALDHLERQLVQHEWLTSDKMQLCDICCAMTASSLGTLIAPLERHARVIEWLQKINEMDGFDINKRGLERLQVLVNQRKQHFLAN